MNEEAMLKQRGPGWRRLHELTSMAGHSFKRLTKPELEEFVRLYRQTCADLAYLTTRSSNESVVTYLNEIVGKAYSQLYREPYTPWSKRVRAAIIAGAVTVRRRRWAVFAAIGVFFAAAFVSSGLLTYSDDFREFYIPQDAGSRANFEHWKSGEFDPRTEEESSMMTAFYASNNPKVSIVTNAVGAVSFGIITCMMLWFNGTMLGALGFEMLGVGKLGFLLSSILPHGVTEIGGIFMAGAGGLIMGAALIRPGSRTRGQALREAGKDAFVLVMLSIVMTLLAAPIEGFFSFDPRIPQWAKILVAVATLGAWLFYFVGYGRSEDVPLVQKPEGLVW